MHLICTQHLESWALWGIQNNNQCEQHLIIYFMILSANLYHWAKYRYKYECNYRCDFNLNHFNLHLIERTHRYRNIKRFAQGHTDTRGYEWNSWNQVCSASYKYMPAKVWCFKIIAEISRSVSSMNSKNLADPWVACRNERGNKSSLPLGKL